MIRMGWDGLFGVFRPVLETTDGQHCGPRWLRGDVLGFAVKAPNSRRWVAILIGFPEAG